MLNVAPSTLDSRAAPKSVVPGFTINGRFYSQPVTGVQRYAREIIRAMDTLLLQRGGCASIVTVRDAYCVPPLLAMKEVRSRRLVGHIWEQAVLPSYVDACLLNLCNTGPVSARPQIVCLHDANVYTNPDSYSRSFRLLYRSLLPRLIRNGCYLSTVSRSASAQIAAHLPVAQSDIAVIPNGHEHVFRWDPSLSVLQRQLGSGRPFVLVLGSRARHKNINAVLQEAEFLDELGLDIAVAGASAPAFAGVDLVSRKNVRWLGTVSDDDLAWLYGHALCLAFPSLSEGFGLPLVEAMALGCPVISSNTTSMPEVCGDAALMAGPHDREIWRSHFERLVSSQALQAELALAGRERVKMFSWETSADLYLRLGAAVTRQPAPGAAPRARRSASAASDTANQGSVE